MKIRLLAHGRKNAKAWWKSKLDASPLLVTKQNGDLMHFINLLMPNVNYSGRTAPLTSKVAFYIFIQQI